MTKIGMISDTHLCHNQFKTGSGDVFIHSGDAELWTERQTESFGKWLASLDYAHKIFVPGNHDDILQEEPESRKILDDMGIHVLINQSVELEGLKFYGSPYTSIYNDWAFMGDAKFMKENWLDIPTNTDVLITHGPPKYILDVSSSYRGNQGCDFLAQMVVQRKPILHCFGHIHEGAGYRKFQDIMFVNSAVCPSFNLTPLGAYNVEIEDKEVVDIYPIEGDWR